MPTPESWQLNLPDTNSQLLHGSCVAFDNFGILILGASGSGKSGLALSLMAFGAMLVSDDQVQLRLLEDQVFASAAPNIAGQIEARGIGILACDAKDRAPVRLVIDLDGIEEKRLPPERMVTMMGIVIPKLHTPVHGHFPAAIVQYVKAGRIA